MEARHQARVDSLFRNLETLDEVPIGSGVQSVLTATDTVWTEGLDAPEGQVRYYVRLVGGAVFGLGSVELISWGSNENRLVNLYRLPGIDRLIGVLSLHDRPRLMDSIYPSQAPFIMPGPDAPPMIVRGPLPR
jgi:hypothetical protein